MSTEQLLPIGDPRFPAFFRLYRFDLMDWIWEHFDKDFMRVLDPILKKSHFMSVEFALAVRNDASSAIDKYYEDMGIEPLNILNTNPEVLDREQRARQEKIDRKKAELMESLKSNTENAILQALFYNEEGIIALDKLIKNYNETLWSQMHLTGYIVEGNPYRELLFKKFFLGDGREGNPYEEQLMDHFCGGMNCRMLAKNVDRFTENDVKPIRELFVNFDFKMPLRRQATCLVRSLFSLPAQTKKEVFWGFIEVLNADPHNRASLCEMFPEWDWTEELERLHDERELIRQRELGASAIQKDEVALVDPKQMRSQLDYWQHRPTCCEDNIIDPMGLQLRTYQEELVKDAVLGSNTLIVAPTGSGKTPVAIHLAMKHLEAHDAAGRRGRVVMLVPRIPLVNQQKEKFNKYLDTKYYVEGIHGSEAAHNSSRRDRILAADVIVITPQILVNMLRTVRECERLFISDFTLLIFDEAHHASKDHPYVVIMNMIKKYDGPKPQIVGLTASPRVSSDTKEVMYTEVVKLLATLECMKISTVHRTQDDLEKFVSKPDDEIREIPKSSDTSVESNFIQMVATTAVQIQDVLVRDHLQKLAELVGQKRDSMWLHPPGIMKNTSIYYNFLNNLEDQLRSIGRNSGKFIPLVTLLYLKALVNVMDMAEVLPMTYAYSHLEIEISHIEETSRVEFCEASIKKLHESMETMLTENKPKICQHLIEEIESQFRKNADSRVIVFVEERGMAVKLADFLNKNIMDGLQTVFVLGTSYKKGARGGYTQSHADQTANLIGFRDGKYKVMVATSVVEEGLDVRDCNLIIKYNCSGSTVQNMQRRGRARAKGSRSILLVLDSRKSDQEYRAFQNEKLLRHVLDTIRQNGEKNLEDRVRIEQEQILRELERLELDEKEKRNKLASNVYNIVCSVCNDVKCQSTSLRAVGTNVVSLEPRVWQHIKLEVTDAIKYKRIVRSNYSLDTFGLVKCGHYVRENNTYCQMQLGRIYKFGGVYMPQFDVKSIQFEFHGNKHGQLVSFATWGEVNYQAFRIPEANDHDLANMLNALAEAKHDDKVKLDLLGVRIQHQIDLHAERGFRGDNDYISGDEGTEETEKRPYTFTPYKPTLGSEPLPESSAPWHTTSDNNQANAIDSYA